MTPEENKIVDDLRNSLKTFLKYVQNWGASFTVHDCLKRDYAIALNAIDASKLVNESPIQSKPVENPYKNVDSGLYGPEYQNQLNTEATQEASEFHISLLRELADTKQNLLATENQLVTTKKMLANALEESRSEQTKIDAARYRKLQMWMSSNVIEGWSVVEQLGAVAAWEGLYAMDDYLDSLEKCDVGFCKRQSASEPDAVEKSHKAARFTMAHYRKVMSNEDDA